MGTERTSLMGTDRDARRRRVVDERGGQHLGRVVRAGEERLHGADHQRGGAQDVDLDQECRQVGEVLRVARRRPGPPSPP